MVLKLKDHDRLAGTHLLLLPSSLSRSVLHEEHPQPHLHAEPHHHVCDAAAPDLLHGSHEHHPGVVGG